MSSVSAIAYRDREHTILNHLSQVKILALRVYRRCPPGVLLEDLVSAGTTGLIEAVDRYDPGRNVQLKTLAEHRIRGAMFDYLRQLDPLPRSVRRFQRSREAAATQLEQRLGREPSENEVAQELGLSIEKYLQLARVVQAAAALSLDHSVQEDSRPLKVAALQLETAEHTLLIRRLDDAINTLPSSERTVILSLRAGHRASEIAQRLKLTESRVSQLKNRAIVRLRGALGVTLAERQQRPCTCEIAAPSL